MVRLKVSINYLISFILIWDGVYSKATRNEPDRTDFSYVPNNTLNSSGQITASVQNNAAIKHHWENNSDQDLAGYANLKYTQKLAGRMLSLLLVVCRHKTRSAYYESYSLSAVKATLFNNNFFGTFLLHLRYHRTDWEVTTLI